MQAPVFHLGQAATTGKAVSFRPGLFSVGILSNSLTTDLGSSLRLAGHLVHLVLSIKTVWTHVVALKPPITTSLVSPLVGPTDGNPTQPTDSVLARWLPLSGDGNPILCVCKQTTESKEKFSLCRSFTCIEERHRQTWRSKLLPEGRITGTQTRRQNKAARSVQMVVVRLNLTHATVQYSWPSFAHKKQHPSTRST